MKVGGIFFCSLRKRSGSNTCILIGVDGVNPSPHMPVLGSFNSAANKIWRMGTIICVENIVGKGEIARYEQFLLFPQCFQKLSVVDASKWVFNLWSRFKYGAKWNFFFFVLIYRLAYGTDCYFFYCCYRYFSMVTCEEAEDFLVCEDGEIAKEQHNIPDGVFYQVNIFHFIW